MVDGTDGTDGRGGMMVGALVGWFRVGSTGAGADPAGATGSSRELGGGMTGLVGAGTTPPPVVDEPLAEEDTVAWSGAVGLVAEVDAATEPPEGDVPPRTTEPPTVGAVLSPSQSPGPGWAAPA